MSTLNALGQQLHEKCMLHFNISYVNRGCGLPCLPSTKDTESVKHDPLKLVTQTHETQDGDVLGLVPHKISLCREIVFPTEM